MYKLSESSKAHREGIDPKLIEISDLAITITLVDFGHDKFAGLREADIQNKLFRDGKSDCDGFIDISEHQAADDGLGKALDFYAYVGRASWQEEHLAMVALAFFQAASKLGYKIEWGGLWKPRNPKLKNGIVYGWDMPHIQLVD